MQLNPVHTEYVHYVDALVTLGPSGGTGSWYYCVNHVARSRV